MLTALREALTNCAGKWLLIVRSVDGNVVYFKRIVIGVSVVPNAYAQLRFRRVSTEALTREQIARLWQYFEQSLKVLTILAERRHQDQDSMLGQAANDCRSALAALSFFADGTLPMDRNNLEPLRGYHRRAREVIERSGLDRVGEYESFYLETRGYLEDAVA